MEWLNRRSGEMFPCRWSRDNAMMAVGDMTRRRPMPGKRIQIDDETWHQLVLLARDRMMTFQELADEAFAEVLKKYDRPLTLKAALRKSANLSAEVVPLHPKGARAGKTRKRNPRA
jgi:hypothetical protein